MKAAIVGLALGLVLAGAAHAGAGSELPAGSYAGTAEWRGPGGTSGTYEVEKTFSGRTLSARYVWKDTAAHEEKHTVTFDVPEGPPTFDVRDESGAVVGRGHCYDDACHYRATFGPVEVEETFRWSGRELSVLGSKSGPGFAVVWKEQLSAR